MKKIKFLIASMIGAIALVFATILGTKINAETENFYNADDATEGVIASGDSIKEDELLNMITYGASSTVSTGYLSGSYAKSLHYDNASNSTNGIKFVNKSDKPLVVDITLAAYDKSTSRKSSDIWFSTDGNYDKMIGTSSTSTTVTVSANLPASNGEDDSYGILCAITVNGSSTSNSRRIVIYEVSYTYVGDNDKQITFYDGNEELASKIYSFGDTISYVPTNGPINYKFDGWYEDISLTTPLSSTTVSSTSASVLYAKWSMYNTYIDQTNMIGDGTSVTSRYACDTIFSLQNVIIEANTGKKMPNTGENCSYRLNPNGSSSSETNKVISFVAPYTCELVFYHATASTGRTIHVCEDTFSKTASDGIFSMTYEDKDIHLTSLNVTKGKTYYICFSGSSIYIYGIYLGLNESVNSSISCQYDKTDALQADAVRFIGTIKGLSATNDYAKLTDATFSFKVDGSLKTKSCSRIYKSVSAYDFAAGTYNLYVVLNISNVSNNIGKNITDLKLTLTFSDGTTKEVTHDSFTLGYTTLVEE